jgi:hypothetical protein
MIDVALKFLVAELNTYLLGRTGSNLGEAALARIVDDAGKWAIGLDHIGAALLNVEEERVLRAHLPEPAFVDGRHVILEPQLKLNLHVLFAAHFQQYDQALKYLAHVLTFFQAHPTFPSDQYPGLDARITKLSPELLSLTYEQLNQVWTFVGGKQLPSVVYRVRLVVLQDVAPRSVEPPLTSIDTVVHAR